MRFLVAWDGSELSTLALRAALHTLAQKGDQLLVYHVTNRGRYAASQELNLQEFELEALQTRLRGILAEVEDAHLRVLVQTKDGVIEDVFAPCSPPCSPDTSFDSSVPGLLTVHEKSSATAEKVSQRIIEFARCSNADVLVMGSMGVKQAASTTFQRTTLGSSAHLAAMAAPCSVVLIRPGYRVDPKLRTVYMVAVDGSQHSYQALQLCSDWARYDKDEVVCHVFGSPEFTQPIEERCTVELQKLMQSRKVEYAVIANELEDSAELVGDELAETAQQCRFKQQAFLVFGARGRQADDKSPEWTPDCTPTGSRATGEPSSPLARRPSTTLGHVARWCIRETQCSLVLARIRPPIQHDFFCEQPDLRANLSLLRSQTAPPAFMVD